MNVIKITDYLEQQQANRIAEAVMAKFHPLSECTMTIEEIEKLIEFEEACRRG